MLCIICATMPAIWAADKPLDDYVVAAQSECFTSKRIASCFRYKAARYLWSAASGRLNFFERDSSRRMVDDSADPVRSSFQFVQLSEPSTAMVFPGARQEMGTLGGDGLNLVFWFGRKLLVNGRNVLNKIKHNVFFYTKI